MTVCFYYDDYAQFTDDRVVTARKAHKCSECRSVIAVGEMYHYHTGKYDGGFYVEKVCRRCDYDRLRVVEHELEEGCDWDEAWPPLGGLVAHLNDSGLGQTRPEEVPPDFKVGDSPRKRSAAAIAPGPHLSL